MDKNEFRVHCAKAFNIARDKFPSMTSGDLQTMVVYMKILEEILEENKCLE